MDSRFMMASMGWAVGGKADSSDRESNDGKLTVNSVYLLRWCTYAGKEFIL